ncbi:branched-chain amino acid transporter permease [Corynebacterium liangguodongii]|uniref:Branched-chain amino acid ABC transporter permease n=1 Tax=Corynebacterium liangguodongii TaxID=2079535 RepID=A0A2S0WGP7_9CORY|nr:AzlD domain-containing protein [Corynebacterium liangguodongii]AWB84951.1 branched-chain amino acid ABC transporter permease [Corynebacterium liangguodongii]PWB99341.1 branched-chain amino acid ABC transporter permease [Corynebacterium liangguodongii]
MGLPDGVTLSMVAAVLIPVGVVTVVLRALPFSFVRALDGSPLVGFLGRLMPVGVMVVLVVYTVVTAAGSPGGPLASLVAAAITLAVHAWRRSPALSIFAGTGAYMLMVNAVF